MTVTMYNEATGVTVRGINIRYINSWNKMGFKVVCYDSPKIVLLQQQRAG